MTVASVEDVVSLVSSGAIPREHPLYDSPISLAANKDQAHLIKPLFECGCTVNTTADGGLSAVELALQRGKSQQSACTLNALLDIGAKRPNGASLLCYAAYCGVSHNVEALLERGHDPNPACPVEKSTALTNALFEPEAHALHNVHLLLKYGADPNKAASTPARNKAMQVPINQLALADLSKFPDRDIEDLLDAMLDNGLKINHDRHDLYHPLAVCLHSKNDRLARMLLARGGDPMHLICFYKNGFSQADVDAATNGGTTPLRTKTPFALFAQSEMPLTVEYMIEHLGEDPAQLLPDGTPLIATVFDPRTKAVLRSAIAQKQMAAAMTDGTPIAPDRPSKRSDFAL